MRLGLFAALVVALILPLAAGAQSLENLGSISGNAFTVSVSPQYPEPYGEATISLTSDSVDLSNATLTVSLAGKELYKGPVHPVSIPLGKAGSVAEVKATVTSGGVPSTQTILIRPQDVVLIAEPISSVPPLYAGKSFVPISGNVRVVALSSLKDASGAVASPATYAYAWTVDGAYIANSSGIGKSSIIVASPLQYRAREVSVVVASASGALAGGASLSLSALPPSVRVYPSDPLLGIIYDRALSGNYRITAAETTLFAAPFSLPIGSSAPLVQWFLNGAPAQTGNFITLRPSGSGQGSASLSVTASAGSSASALADLSLMFGKSSSTNFFGL